jgi:threonine/homoserine/homoserine lactone efflux protein
MIMNVSARQGRLAGISLALGIVTGSIFWACVAALGFVATLKTSVAFFTAMKIAGGAYLLFLSFRALRSAATRTKPGAPAPAPGPVSVRRQYLRGLLLHLTNPKAPLVWMATLSVGTGYSAPPAFLGVAIALCTLSAVGVFVGYAYLFSTRRAISAYRNLRRPVDFVVGTLFGAAGIRILTLRAA